MSNIIQDITSLVSSELLTKTAGQLGESEGGITKVLGGLAPTILAGMLNKSNDAGAFGKIFDSLGTQANSGALDNFGSLLDGGGNDIAGGLMSSLFGDKMGGIMDIITSLSGVKKSSSSSLLGMVAPMVMSYLGKKILSGGLSAMGLSKLLGGQRSNIAAALPAGIGDLIGFAAEAPKSPTAEIPKLSTSTGGGNNLFKYLLPILLLAAAYMGWKSCGDDVKSAASSATEVVGDAAGTMTEAATDAAGRVADATGDAIAGLGSFFKRKLANGLELNIPELGIESKLIDFIEGDAAVDKTTWFNFDRLTFNTGSADLDMDKSKEQLENIASILKAYPGVHIKLGGYTDNTGSASGNMTLSQNRADNVMAAIQALGISEDRLAAEGYGAEHPVASNETEEGRAQNRRIALRVSQK